MDIGKKKYNKEESKKRRQLPAYREWMRKYYNIYRKVNAEKIREIKRRSTQKNRYKISIIRRNKIFKYKSLAGGKCSICGYNKNLAALTFHHRENKDILMCKIFNYNNEYILKEMEKCILLCFNCHQELHHPSWDRKLWLIV